MTDKVQLIKEWVENLKNQSPTIPNLGINALAGFQLACNDVIAFIDSLPKEHASEDLTHAAYRYANNLHTKRQIQLFEEKDVAADFIAGAEWQHGKDFDDLLQSEMKFPKEFYEKGRSDMREEMMNALVNGEVVKDIHN